MNTAQLFHRLKTYVVNIMMKTHFQTISTPRYLMESAGVMQELLTFWRRNYFLKF